MKKLLLGAIFAALAVPGVAGATVPADEVSIAGLTLGEPLVAVAESYGMPDRRDGKTYVYDKGLRVEFAADVLVSAKIESNIYQSTLSGVTVGTSVDALTAVYGRPDIKIKHDGNVIYIYTAGDRQLCCDIKGGSVAGITAEVIR